MLDIELYSSLTCQPLSGPFVYNGIDDVYGPDQGSKQLRSIGIYIIIELCIYYVLAAPDWSFLMKGCVVSCEVM